MPVKVNKEPKDWRYDPPENCFKCHRPTRYWHKNDVPCCPACAAVIMENDVPTKPEYMAASRKRPRDRNDGPTFGEIENRT